MFMQQFHCCMNMNSKSTSASSQKRLRCLNSFLPVECFTSEQGDSKHNPRDKLRKTQPTEDQYTIATKGFEEKTRRGRQNSEGEKYCANGRIRFLEPDKAKDQESSDKLIRLTRVSCIIP